MRKRRCSYCKGRGCFNCNNLSKTLHYGNNSGTYSIIMGTATSIKSLNGGAAISLDTSGLAKNIFISTDGVGMESSIEMTPSTFDLTNLTGNKCQRQGSVSS